MKRLFLIALGLFSAGVLPRAAAEADVRITNRLPGPPPIGGATPGQFGSAAFTSGR